MRSARQDQPDLPRRPRIEHLAGWRVEIGVLVPAYILIKMAAIGHKPHEVRQHPIVVDLEFILPLCHRPHPKILVTQESPYQK